MAKKSKEPYVAERQEGTLWHDRDDGWTLEGEEPASGCRIKDLFVELEGKKVRITIEVLP